MNKQTAFAVFFLLNTILVMCLPIEEEHAEGEYLILLKIGFKVTY